MLSYGQPRLICGHFVCHILVSFTLFVQREQLYGSINNDIDKTRRAAHFCLQKVRIVIFTIGVEPPKAPNELPEGCILVKDKTTKLVSSCPFRVTKGKTTLEDCVGSLTQYNANTINYSPSRQECNMKACTDENDANTNLGKYGSAEFDVYYCREYYFHTIYGQNLCSLSFIPIQVPNNTDPIILFRNHFHFSSGLS